MKYECACSSYFQMRTLKNPTTNCLIQESGSDFFLKQIGSEFFKSMRHIAVIHIFEKSRYTQNFQEGESQCDKDFDCTIHRDLEQMEPKVISPIPSEGGKLVILLHNST